MKKVFAAIATIALAFAMFGCAAAPEENALAGIYSIESMHTSSADYSASILETLGIDDLITMEINDDNTGKLNLLNVNYDITVDPEKNQMSFSSNGKTDIMDYTIEEGKITFEVDGQTITMAKDDSNSSDAASDNASDGSNASS